MERSDMSPFAVQQNIDQWSIIIVSGTRHSHSMYWHFFPSCSTVQTLSINLFMVQRHTFEWRVARGACECVECHKQRKEGGYHTSSRWYDEDAPFLQNTRNVRLSYKVLWVSNSSSWTISDMGTASWGLRTLVGLWGVDRLNAVCMRKTL